VSRYVCIHGHFYQPPRENPWLEMVELQDSAYPFHDWNERITAECYGPNSVARVLDSGGRISRLMNNYSRISFNFGPTLLAWFEGNAPDVYQRVLDADREGRERFGGHGPALAQVYNHIIMPLANREDKVSQVVWGVHDFRRRFGREPEGMWLAETAADVATLEVLAEQGIKFTVLAPGQAARVRPLGAKAWTDVGGGRVDPSVAYVQKLPSGRSIALFFYDGPVSQAVAFERLLIRGEALAGRLTSAFSDDRKGAQLVHIATDGESYGHHHAHGDMALAYALDQLSATPGVTLTIYGEFLELHPPQFEAEIHDNSSWSCVHGVERWRSNCGCNSGKAGWQQEWRGPLRAALDGARDAAGPLFEEHAGELLKNPWAARNDYIDVILDRSPGSIDAFFARHSRRTLGEDDRVRAIKLLEMQRFALLMYTSCGWFFDEISGIETVQILMYAGRMIQLASETTGAELEPAFLEALGRAPSNVPKLHKTGRDVYEKYVRPARINFRNIAAHYAVASLFQSFEETSRVFCYDIIQEAAGQHEAGKIKLVVGHARLHSDVTLEGWDFAYAALHLGDHNVNAGVTPYPGDPAFAETRDKLAEAFARVDTPQLLRIMDRSFGEAGYSIASLFRDLQRQVLKKLLRDRLDEMTEMYQRSFDTNLPLMRFLQHLSVPIPMPLQATAEVLFNSDLRWAFKDDDPDFEQIRFLVDEAKTWGLPMDGKALGFKLTKMLDRAAQRWAAQPEQLEPLATLLAGVELAGELPFESNLWTAQNVYFDVRGRAFDEAAERSARDPAAARWVEMFLELGDKLGVVVGPEKKKALELRNRPDAATLVGSLIAGRHVPGATYRFQFRDSFPFREARGLVAYLEALGVTDVYSSPVLQATKGSPHGYDICDHSKVSEELGGEAELLGLAADLDARGMGLVIDIVPNHMAVGNADNAWWRDVLEHGASSRFADTFDIDWRPTNPDLEYKVLLPILGDQYGKTLEAGHLRLAYDDGAFSISYYDTALPVAPTTYIPILSSQVEDLARRLGDDHDHVLEYRSILTALHHLPPRTGLAEERQAERYREVAIIKRRLADLVAASPEVRGAVAGAVDRYNGRVGQSESFDAIDRLISDQSYRPAFWLVAMDEINYRRFFDVNELAAIRIEDPDVFEATHQVTFRLLASVRNCGLRVDHPDGLYAPTRYFKDLQERYLVDRLAAADGGPVSPAARAEALEALDRVIAEGGRGPLYVVAEKILGEGESLPADWAVDGTSGYDFLNACNLVFVGEEEVRALRRLYREVTGEGHDFDPLVRKCKQLIMQNSMASEINTLSHQLDRITERNRGYRDFTMSNLRYALREFIASLAIYRSYTTPDGRVSDRDRHFVELACDEAKRQNRRSGGDIFNFIRDTVLLRNLGRFPREDRPRVMDWVLRFQQVTGPIMAKGIEDTAFYVDHTLISLNEVGGHPEPHGSTVEAFHKANAERAAQWPTAMLCSSTHDTKRSEDARARINVLADMAGEWAAEVRRWYGLAAPHAAVVDGEPAPTLNDQYLLFQTLVGTWPDPAPRAAGELAAYRDRVVAYMEKATREAKQKTSWINPHAAYDDGVRKFTSALLGGPRGNPFLDAFGPFAARVARLGRFNSLSQVVMKLTSPGVPDLYQGNELWDFSLVDPDNRRPVDYAARVKALESLRPALEGGDAGLDARVAELLAGAVDGRIKMYVTARLLRHRRERRDLYLSGGYRAVEPRGPGAGAVCAYERRHGGGSLIVAVCTRPASTTAGGDGAPVGPDVWRDTALSLPELPASARLRDLLTGRVLAPSAGPEGGSALPLGLAFATLPVAVIEADA